MPTTKTRNPRRLRDRALGDTSKLESLGMRAARRVAARVRAEAVRSLREGRTFESWPLVEQALLPLVKRAAAVSHVAGMRRSMLMMKQQLRAPEERAMRTAARHGSLRLDVLDPALRLLRKTLKRRFDMRALTEQYSAQALHVLQDVSKAVDFGVRKKVAQLIEEGVTVRRAVTELGAELDRLGVGALSESRLETVFRTQVQVAYGAGRWEQDQDPDVQEVLWGYRYVTVGDDRVREEHAALDGTTLPKDDPFWDTYWPPNGWNCRCQAVPVFEEREVVRPGTVDGAVPSPSAGFAFNAGKVLGGLSYAGLAHVEVELLGTAP